MYPQCGYLRTESDYGTSSVQSGARFSSRTPRTLCIASDTGSGKPGIVVAPQQASVDNVPQGDKPITSSWDDSLIYAVGNHPSQFVIFTSGDKPSDRDAPEMNGNPIFSGENFVDCTDIKWSGSLTCTYDLSDALLDAK